MLKVILSISILLPVFVSGCFLMKVYRDQYHDVTEKHDARGRLVSRTIVGYDCCEGSYENNFEFDTTGKLLREYGFRDGDKYTNFFTYDAAGRLLLAEHYGGYIGGDTSRSFNRNDCYPTSIEKHAYYADGQESYFHVVDFSRYIAGDTFSYSLIEYDTSGKKTKWINRFGHCACFPARNDTCIVYVQLKDELLQTVDTVRIKRNVLDRCAECEVR